MLTDLSIKGLKPPEKGQKTYWDKDGLGVRVSQGGAKTFVLMHGWPRRLRITIGKYPTLSLAMARDAAKTFLARKQLGHHISPTLPFSDAVQLFLDQQTHLKASTRRDYERILTKRFEPKLRRHLLNEVQTHHVTDVLDNLLRHPAERKYCFSVIRRFFRWARGRRLVAQSPIEGLDAPKPVKSRDRVLSDDEIRRVWRAAEGRYGAIVRLLILLGQRREEIASIEPSWRRSQLLTIPASQTKNGREHAIPLPEAANSYLAELRHFSGWSKAKRQLDKRILENWREEVAATGEKAEFKFPAWTLHDLRRTYATNLQKLGVRIEVIETLLNHVSGSKAGIVGVYQRHDYMPEMREAVTLWEEHLLKLLAAA
jgi:integrase